MPDKKWMCRNHPYKEVGVRGDVCVWCKSQGWRRSKINWIPWVSAAIAASIFFYLIGSALACHEAIQYQIDEMKLK